MQAKPFRYRVRESLPFPAIVVLDGRGYKPEAEAWLRNQVDGNKLLNVFDLTEFQTWANSDELRHQLHRIRASISSRSSQKPTKLVCFFKSG